MKTAEEKREVAENLRAQAAYPGSSSMYMEAFMDDLRQIIDTYNMSNNYADLYDILADLIEPSEDDQWVTSQGLTKEQLEFDWWLSERVMHELGFDGDTADRDEVESRLLARLMPEGYEWPRFEDGEPVRFGDGFLDHQGNERSVLNIKMWQEGGFEIGTGQGTYDWHSAGERVRRPAPKVLDADGVEIRIGDEVFDIETGKVHHAATIDPAGKRFRSFEQMSDDTSWLDSMCFTHQRPVLDADGVPTLSRVSEDGTVYLDLDRLHAGDDLTHAKPEPTDSWERIEEDTEKSFSEYWRCEKVGCSRCPALIDGKTPHEFFGCSHNCTIAMKRDLMRRCRALAERERGE